MSVLNVTLRNDISEDETLRGGNAWKEQVLYTTTSDRAEVSYTGISSRVLRAACVYLLYAECQYLLVEGNRVNNCVNLCEIGWRI
jgi:hypothetical protein